MPDDLFATPIENQNNIRSPVTGHHFGHIDASPLVGALWARLSCVAHTFCQKAGIGTNQQIVFPEEPINALSINWQPGDKSKICPNSAITPKRMVAFNNSNLFEQQRASAETLRIAQRRGCFTYRFLSSLPDPTGTDGQPTGGKPEDGEQPPHEDCCKELLKQIREQNLLLESMVRRQVKLTENDDDDDSE
jgi:hypothetical protein